MYNLGIGRRVSVREIIDAAARVTGREIPVRYGERRTGDPPALFADASKIERKLGWTASVREVGPMIESAWRWMQENPERYREG